MIATDTTDIYDAAQYAIAVPHLPWVTPAHYFRRTAMRDLELRGKIIREGDRVVLHYTAANFDDDVIHDPQRFDVTRDPNLTNTTRRVPVRLTPR